MRVNSITCRLAACAVALLAHLPSPARARMEQPEVAAEILPEEVVLSMGEPVFAELRVRNESIGPVRIDFGRNFLGNVHLVVNGVTAPPPGMPPGGGISFPGEATLKPGEVYARRLLLNEWHDFSEPGKYEIRLMLESQPIRLEASMTLEIGPRDPARLAEVCEELATMAKSYHAEQARQAGKALSYAGDKACLPAMVRVLKESFTGKEGAIAGLARLGTPAAIQAIVDAWDSLRWDQRAGAFQELWKRGKQDDLRAALAKAGKSDKVEIPWSGRKQ